MDKFVEKFPYKKILYMNWYEAAIAYLLLFKSLKERASNNVYFLVSDQGIMLKGTTAAYLKSTEEEINKFFTAKIEQLELSGSSQFYENIIDDIKEQTKLRDSRDCPYINLVYSEKLKHCCLAMKKFGYLKPYENWESHERDRRGFCFLIVRPENSWKEIANIVMTLVKKRSLGSEKTVLETVWPIEMSYEKFLWLFLSKQLANLRKHVEIKEKKVESMVVLAFTEKLSELSELERHISNLQTVYCEKRPEILTTSISASTPECFILSSLEIEKITELIYHEFGLPNLVRELRKKSTIHLLLCPEGVKWKEREKTVSGMEEREDMTRINQSQITLFYKLGNRHEIVSYDGLKFVQVRFDAPLEKNILNSLSVRLPCLPKYYYWMEDNDSILMLRKYESNKLKSTLEKLPLFEQVFLMNSLILIVQHLHLRKIYIGKKFSESIFVDGRKVVIEPAENGTLDEDICKLTLVVREWVKSMPNGELKIELEKICDPYEMLQMLEGYLEANS